MDVASHPGVCPGGAHGVLPQQRHAQGGVMLPGVGAVLAACTAPPSASAQWSSMPVCWLVYPLNLYVLIQ